MTKTHLQHDKEREVNGQTAILAERLAAAERERDEYMARADESDEFEMRGRREIATLRAQLAELNSEAERQQETIDTLHNRLTDARDQYADADARADSAVDSATEAQMLVEDLRAQLAEARLELSQAESLWQRLVREREEAREKYETAEQWRRRYRDKLIAAKKLAYGWAHSARWPVPVGQSIIGVLEDMRSMHCDERSYADLVASGGLPETQELHPEIADLRAQLAERSRDSERLYCTANEIIAQMTNTGMTYEEAVGLIYAAMHDDSAEPKGDGE